MFCINCGAGTQVVNSRHQIRGGSIWRRRKCLACGAVFTTIEQIDYEKLWSVQTAHGQTRPFLRDKLFVSLYKSLGHRQTADSDAVGLTATVIGNIRKLTDAGVVTSTVIATLAYDALRHFDKAAATMYAAYHNEVL